MDPEATLNTADQAISDGNYTTAREALAAYQAWRNNGGFQPNMRHAAKPGDAFARECSRRLTDATQR
jgi:hypothetical protein